MTCPICKDHTADMVADHCHITGVARDFICRPCNAGLGMFKDNPANLRAAAAYLQRHKRAPRVLDYSTEEMATVTQRSMQRRARAELLDSQNRVRVRMPPNTSSREAAYKALGTRRRLGPGDAQ